MRSFQSLLCMAVSCLWFGCTHITDEMPVRLPANMPVGSTFIPISKGSGLWQACWIEKETLVRCRICNRVGSVMKDDEFIVYRGSAVKRKDELQIVPKGSPDLICLANGTILIPKTEWRETKEFLDKTNPSLASRCPL
jgi:hypothetical protein